MVLNCPEWYLTALNGTYCPEEPVHVSWIRVHNQLKDLLMSHFTEHLPVGGRSSLSDVHIRAYCGWRLHQVLKLDEAWNS
jgi:hypothetical protein